MTNHCHSRTEDYFLQFFRNLNKHRHLWNYLSASPTPQQLPCFALCYFWSRNASWSFRPDNPRFCPLTYTWNLHLSTEECTEGYSLPNNSVTILLVDVHLPQLIFSYKIICSFLLFFHNLDLKTQKGLPRLHASLIYETTAWQPLNYTHLSLRDQ